MEPNRSNRFGPETVLYNVMWKRQHNAVFLMNPNATASDKTRLGPGSMVKLNDKKRQ